MLIQHGAEPDVLAQGNATPLHYAAQGGRSECVEMLIECGAAKDARTVDGNTALHLASSKG